MILVAATPSASAERGRAEFGDPGTYTLAGSLSLAQTSFESPIGDVRFVSASLAPEVDYFVLPNVAVQVRAEGWFQSGGGAASFGVGPGLGLGYYAPLSPSFGFFPKASAIYRYARTRYDDAFVAGVDPDSTSHTIDVAIELPLLARFGQFFVGIGPRFRTQVFGRSKTDDAEEAYSGGGSTRFALSTRIGGWFD